MEHPGLRAFERAQMKKEYPYFQAGDTVRVNMRVIEGEKERIQAFEGVVISRSGGGLSETFTVRKISYGTGVERTFPLHSPRIESVKVVRRGRVRRAKLYYLRERIGKATRIKARRRQFNNARATVILPEDVVPVTENVAIEDMVQEEPQVEAAAEQDIETADETEAVAPEVETPAEESSEEKQ